MKDILLLTNLYIKSLFGVNRMRYSKGKNARRKRVLFALGAPLIVILLLASAGTYCIMMAMGLALAGDLTAMPVTMFAMSGAFTLISCAYKGGEILLGFKDSDLQLSMPLSLTSVAVSRLVIQYVTSMSVVLLIMLPAGAVYAYFAAPAWTFYPAFLLCVIALPLLPSVIGSAIGVLITRVSARFKGSKYLNIVFMFAFFAAYMYAVFSMNMGSEEAFGQLAANISGKASRIYPPAALFARAIQGDAVSLLGFLAVSAIPFALASYGFTRCMRNLRSRVMEKRARGSYKMKALTVKSPVAALYRKEFSRYFASSIYVLNTAFGVVIALVVCVAAIVMGKSGVEALFAKDGMPGMEAFLPVIPYALGFLVSTCCTTGSSISMEGKAVWIAQSIPVSGRALLFSKALVNLTVIAPGCLLAPAVMCWLFAPDFLTGLSFFLVPIAYGALNIAFGLWLNLKSHRFDWKTETEIVKQSMAAGMPIFLSMLLCFAPGAYSMVKPDLALPIACAAFLAVSLIALALTGILRASADREVRAL